MTGVAITCESRFEISPDGRVWTAGPGTYAFWRRYLDVFDEVTIIARAHAVDRVNEGQHEVCGAGVRLAAVPYYVGPKAYLIRACAVRQAVRQALEGQSAVVLRAPGRISELARASLVQRRPYGVELVGDPYEVFAPGASTHPLRAFFRWKSTSATRAIAAGACATAYVSRIVLPDRYPASPGSLSMICSDIELKTDHIVAQPRHNRDGDAAVIVTVGSLAQPYKGVDLLIEAVSMLHEQLPNVALRVVGDGVFRVPLEELARQRGVAHIVTFIGQLASGNAVRAELDGATLFVMASRTEGLPRAMIEAMARGLPCIGTSVGGIPELLPLEDMVPPNDAQALADMIAKVLSSPVRMRAMADRNLATAAEYRDDVLRDRRNAFYRCVRDRTEEWRK